MTDPDTILLETEEAMEKALTYLKNELRGIRTGRAHPSLVEFVKVDYYGSMTDLKALAAVSTPEATQLLIKPFDQGAIPAIKKAIEASGLGFNPISEGKQLRINVPALSGDRRLKLIAQVKKHAEEQKVAIRNTRRDANKHVEALGKQPGGKHYPEDELEQLKNEIQELLKKYEGEVDRVAEAKIKEVQEV
jgi:ribosome recycling factor